MNGYADISKNNQIKKFKLKDAKKQHYENVIKYIIKEYEMKIKEKINKLSMNNYKFNNQIIKQSVLNDYQQQVNKVNCLNAEIMDYYEDEYVKFKNKFIINFSKFCKKIKIMINNNNPFNINYDREINEANKLKENRKSIQ